MKIKTASELIKEEIAKQVKRNYPKSLGQSNEEEIEKRSMESPWQLKSANDLLRESRS